MLLATPVIWGHAEIVEFCLEEGNPPLPPTPAGNNMSKHVCSVRERESETEMQKAMDASKMNENPLNPQSCV